MTSIRPERGRLPHRHGRERQVLHSIDEGVQPSEPLPATVPQQFPPYFAVDELGHDDA